MPGFRVAPVHVATVGLCPSTGLLEGPTGGLFLMSEVPLYFDGARVRVAPRVATGTGVALGTTDHLK